MRVQEITLQRGDPLARFAVAKHVAGVATENVGRLMDATVKERPELPSDAGDPLIGRRRLKPSRQKLAQPAAPGESHLRLEGLHSGVEIPFAHARKVGPRHPFDGARIVRLQLTSDKALDVVDVVGKRRAFEIALVSAASHAGILIVLCAIGKRDEVAGVGAPPPDNAPLWSSRGARISRSSLRIRSSLAGARPRPTRGIRVALP